MLRSLFSGISGMKSQQTKMDVIGNNIANVNTTAFKSQRVTFKDMLSQTMQNATSPTITLGGTNPKQVGLGVGVSAIDTDVSQGSLQPTGRSTDMAIEGNGFFIASNGNDTFYTRDGSFTLDKNGDLVTSEGLHIVGSNNVDSSSKYINIPLEHEVVKPISIFNGDKTAEPPTDEEIFKIKIYGLISGNIKSIVPTKNDEVVEMDAGNSKIKKYFTINDEKTITIDVGSITELSELEREVNKELSQIASLSYEQIDKLADKDELKRIKDFINTGIFGISFTGSGNLSEIVTGTTNADAPEIEKMKLTSFGVGKDGKIMGVYGEESFKVGEIQIATFQNPAGLEKKGSNLYMASSNSGNPTVGIATSPGYGNIEQGHLEMSKVDLANEFTEMIITSRAFQANSRTITTSDEMLQELLNLKR